MDSQDLVRERRQNVGRAPSPIRGWFVSAALCVLAFGLAAGGVGLLAGGRPAPAPVSTPPALQAAAAPIAWTKDDDKRCATAAQKAIDAAPRDQFIMARSSIARGGFARMAGQLSCALSTKTARFCNPDRKAALVARINDYFTRFDAVMLGLAAEGSAVTLMGTMLGGEAEGGAGIHDIQTQDTIGYMQVYHGPVTASLRRLIAGGVLAQQDFGLYGMGMSGSIASLFTNIKPADPICG